MFLTNAVILTVELKKLLKDRCHAEVHGDDYIVVHIGAGSDSHTGCIDIFTPHHSVCNIKIVVRYVIPQEQVAEITTKLKDGDAITIHDNGIRVSRERTIELDRFDRFSTEEIEHTAEDIVNTLWRLVI